MDGSASVDVPPVPHPQRFAFGGIPLPGTSATVFLDVRDKDSKMAARRGSGTDEHGSRPGSGLARRDGPPRTLTRRGSYDGRRSPLAGGGTTGGTSGGDGSERGAPIISPPPGAAEADALQELATRRGTLGVIAASLQKSIVVSQQNSADALGNRRGGAPGGRRSPNIVNVDVCGGVDFTADSAETTFVMPSVGVGARRRGSLLGRKAGAGAGAAKPWMTPWGKAEIKDEVFAAIEMKTTLAWAHTLPARTCHCPGSTPGPLHPCTVASVHRGLFSLRRITVCGAGGGRLR